MLVGKRGCVSKFRSFWIIPLNDNIVRDYGACSIRVDTQS